MPRYKFVKYTANTTAAVLFQRFKLDIYAQILLKIIFKCTGIYTLFVLEHSGKIFVLEWLINFSKILYFNFCLLLNTVWNLN